MMPANQRALIFLSANQKALRFLGLFALIFGTSYFVFGIAPGIREHLIRPYTEWLAAVLATTLNWFHEGATVVGEMVISNRYSMTIAMGCDGVEASCLFMAGVLAYPATRRAKLIGVLAGMPLIHLINLLRLIGLFYAGVYFPSVVEELHVYVAQTIVILLSTAILIVWLERFAVRPRRA
jgi:exosortase H (IPTLxxWG-CTERM-specific)